MGTVHGVYLKYVGLSALSYCGYSWLNANNDTSTLLSASSSNMDSRSAVDGSLPSSSTAVDILTTIVPSLVLGYSTLVNGTIAVLFKAERGMSIIGKNRATGTIPMWSYIIFFPFHIPTMLYTKIHTNTFYMKQPDKQVRDTKDESPSSSSNRNSTAKVKVPVATEVQPGWWVGGCYGHKLNKDWAGVIDLTVEFPEKCYERSLFYLSLPTWDGVPCTPEQLEYATNFALNAKSKKEEQLQQSSDGNNKVVGDILVHCAHGRGRSTTVMCACLVKAGLFKHWEEAFEVGIKPYRPVCKLNRRMRQNLQAWQEQYIDKKNAADDDAVVENVIEMKKQQ